MVGVAAKTSNLRNFTKKIIILLPMLTCLDSYCVAYILDFPITVSFLAFALVFVLSIFLFNGRAKDLVLIGFMVVLCLLKGFLNVFNVTSTLLYLFYFGLFSLCTIKLGANDLLKSTKILVCAINLLSIIALLQMISNFMSVGRFDIIIDGHMVDGFNRTNQVYIGNYVFWRSNSLYLEPSILSQYCAFAIIGSLYLYKYKSIKKRYRNITIIFSLLAMICSVSGTGPLMLIFVAAVYYIKKRHTKNDLCILALLLLCAAFLAIVMPKELKKYILSRLSEVMNPELSGGMRFTVPYIAAIKTLATTLIGFGPGNEWMAMKKFYPEIFSIQPAVASGYAKICIELGLTGLLVLCACIKKTRNRQFFYIYLYVVLINAVGGNLLQTRFWVFMILLKCLNNKNLKMTANNKLLVSTNERAYI